jgi:hypothetical protein
VRYRVELKFRILQNSAPFPLYPLGAVRRFGRAGVRGKRSN